MHDGIWMVMGFASATLGMAWLALAMDVHWRDVHGSGSGELSAASVKTLRVLGAVALTVSLVCCLQADVATMAALVWMIALTLAAMTVAFTLTWRPGVLRVLWRGGPKTTQSEAGT